MAPSKKKKHPKPSKKKKPSTSSSFNPIQGVQNFFADKHPVLKFLLGFVGCMVLFYLFYYSSLYKNFLEIPFLNAQANISNILLRILGYQTEVINVSIVGNDFSVNIKNGCDGLEAIAIFMSGILIFPAPARLKMPGLLIGTLTLLVLNLLRMAGLYLVGLYFSPTVFEILHVQGGFIIFTMISVILWFIWMDWVVKQSQPLSKTIQT